MLNKIFLNVISNILMWIKPNSKRVFIKNLGKNARIFDIGCGNDSAILIKGILPKCNYTGIDIDDYNISDACKSLMDTYVLSKPDEFSDMIGTFKSSFDGVISNHNLEHCDEPSKTLDSMLLSLKAGGKIFLAFPSKETVRFPSREGTLNYFDDKTHKYSPPDCDEIIKKLANHGLTITYVKKKYQPFIPYLIGAILEPISIVRKKVMRGTWEYYGFETIIQAKKND
jgi:SAM-dependent methyltransferase